MKAHQCLLMLNVFHLPACLPEIKNATQKLRDKTMTTKQITFFQRKKQLYLKVVVSFKVLSSVPSVGCDPLTLQP